MERSWCVAGYRRLVLLVLALVMGPVLPFVTGDNSAEAAVWARNRHGIAHWAPQTAWIRTDEGFDLGGSVWVTVGFRWDDANHMRELTGQYRGLEVKVRTDPGFASRVVSARSNFGGYLDTPFGDASCCTFGWGAVNTSGFRPGVNYEVTFELAGNQKPLTDQFGLRLDFQATSDALTPGVSDPFRMFGDFSYTMIRASDLRVSRNRNTSTVVVQNALWAQSFEEGSNSFQRYAMLDARNNRVVYCRPDGGYRSNCFLEFNRGAAPYASVFQDVTMQTARGDNLTAEAMVRCPVNQGSCPITLAIWGLDNGAESRSVGCKLPSDGRWYSIRLDGNHGFGVGFSNAHSRIRWELYNQGTGSVSVDFTTLADGYSTVVGGTNFVPYPSAGSACSLMD